MTHSRYIFWLFFFGLGASLTSCKDTCEEAVKKTISDLKGIGDKEWKIIQDGRPVIVDLTV